MSDRLTVHTSIDNSGIKSGISKMNSIISTGVKASVASIGAITTALVSTGAAFTKFGMDFTSSFAKPTTLFGDVSVDIENLQSNILSLSNASGESASSLNEGLYSALSAGIPITEDAAGAVEFLTMANKLAVAGYTDTDTAITATAKTLNAYGLGIEETSRIQNVLIQTQNKGIVTVDELGKNLSKVTPVSAAYGVSIEQVGAAISTLTAKGTGAAESTTQLKNLFTEMGKSGTTFSNMLNEMSGKTFTDLLNEGHSFVEVLGMVTEYAEKQGVAIDSLFTSSESVLAAMTLSGQGAEIFADNLGAMNTEVDLVTEGYNKMADTLEFKTNRIKETLKNIGTSVFLSSMENDLKSAADYAQTYLDKIYEIIKPVSGEEQKTPAEIIEGLTGIVTEALTDVSELIISGLPIFTELGINIINNIIDGILSMLDSLTNVLPEISNVLIEEIPYLLENVFDGLSGVLLELLPVALQIIIDFIIMVVEELPNYVDKLLVLISQLLVSLLKVLGDNSDKIVDSLINSVISIINTVIDFLTNDEFNVLITTILDVVIQIVIALANAIPKVIAANNEFGIKIVNAVVNLFLTLVPVIIDALFTLVNSIAEELPRLFEELVERLNTLFEEEKDLFGEFPEKFGKFLADTFISVFTGLVNLGNIILGWFGFDDVYSKMEEFGANVHSKFVEIDEGVKNFLGDFSNDVKTKIKDSFEGIKTTINNVKGFSKTVGDWLTTSYENFEEFKNNAIEKASSSVNEFIVKFNESDLGMYVGNWLDSARNKFDDFKYELGIKAIEAFNNFMSGLDILSNFGSSVKEKLDESINYVVDFGTDLYDKGKSLAESIINGIKDKFNAVGNIFEDIGENLMSGISNGIENTKSFISDKVSEITEGAKNVFGIHSPSKVWEKEIGHYLGEGLVVGFEKDNPVKQIEGIMQSGIDRINVQSSLNNAILGSNRGDYNQTINFNGATNSPDEIARAVRLQSKYGLAGAY